MAYSDRLHSFSMRYALLFVISISSQYYYAQSGSCSIDSESKYVHMCEDGCSNFSLADENTYRVSLKPTEGLSECNMTVEVEAGYGIQLRASIFFEIQPCEENCGNDNYVSFTDETSSSCTCGIIQPYTLLYSTDESTVTIQHHGGAFSVIVYAVGCPTEGLTTGQRARVEYINGSPKTGESYIANVTCPEGYILNKKYHYVENTCEIIGTESNFGRWQGPSVRCKKVKCKPPPMPDNGTYTPYIPYTNQYKYMFDEEITYACDSGYDLAGPTKRKCTSEHGVGAHFDQTPPSCKRKDCGPLPNITYGYIYDLKVGTLYGAIYKVECDRGYKIKGNESITCLEDGTWSEPATCELIVCPEPPNIAHSTYTVRGSLEGIPRAFNSDWRFTCNAGFMLTGDPIMSCQLNGTWTTPPTCTAERCELDGLPNHPHYECVDCDTNWDTRVNSTRTYQCIEGYVEKIEVTKCLKDGSWTPISKCQRINCGEPKEVVHGEWDFTGIRYGDQANLTCHLGYTLDNPENVLTCSETGSWVNGPRCQEVDCGAPPTGRNLVMARSFTTNYNSKVSFYCEKGYYISSSHNSIECDKYGKWTDLPTCAIKDCGQPDSLMITNGTYEQTYKTTYNSVISYKCDYGYMFVSEDSRICQADKTWSTLPQCVEIDCALPSNISSAKMLSNNGTRWRDLVFYQCFTDEGLVIVSGECIQDGTWSYPSCPQKKPDKMIYVYIGCSVGVLFIVLSFVLLFGLCFRRKEKTRKLNEMALSERSKKRTDGSQCSNDSGIDGEQDHPHSLSNYDCKNLSTTLLPAIRTDRSPETQYSTNSLNKPRSRQPITNSYDLGGAESNDLGEELENPLYGENRSDRFSSRNFSPRTVRNSPDVSIGVGSPLLPHFKPADLDDNRSTRPFNTLNPPGRPGNAADPYRAHSMDRYQSSPKALRVLPGQDLIPTQDHLHSPNSLQDSAQTLYVPRGYHEVPSVYM